MARVRFNGYLDKGAMTMTDFAGVSGLQLRQMIERIERLEEDKAAIASDIKEVYAEAKSHGFDPKIIRKMISIRKMDQDERAEYEELLTVYFQALERASRSARDIAQDTQDAA
jgi:uncharacterized protein (UPF0335 family)